MGYTRRARPQLLPYSHVPIPPGVQCMDSIHGHDLLSVTSHSSMHGIFKHFLFEICKTIKININFKEDGFLFGCALYYPGLVEELFVGQFRMFRVLFEAGCNE